MRDLWAFLRFVEDRGQSISPGVFRVARLKEGQPLPRFLTEEEYRRLEVLILNKTAAGTWDDRLDRAWFYLLAYGGLRLSELCDLRLGDVDLGGLRLAVREGKGKRDRIIPLSVTTTTVLHDYLAVRGTGPRPIICSSFVSRTSSRTWCRAACVAMEKPWAWRSRLIGCATPWPRGW